MHERLLLAMLTAFAVFSGTQRWSQRAWWRHPATVHQYATTGFGVGSWVGVLCFWGSARV